jgi:protein-S-isoprenylcysteine O-methyltransferase Ste14
LFIALFGEGVVHWPTLFSVGLFPIIVFAYYRLARKEEQKTIEKFGEKYLEYQRHVPMFIPMKGKWKQLVEHSNVSSN